MSASGGLSKGTRRVSPPGGPESPRSSGSSGSSASTGPGSPDRPRSPEVGSNRPARRAPSSAADRPVRWIQLGGERVAEVQPAPERSLPRPARVSGDPEAARPRVIGPGKLERGYCDRIESLERSVELSALVERGTARLVDRLETEVAQERGARAREKEQAHRLMVALGAVQRENELLRAKVEALEFGSHKTPELAGPARESVESSSGPGPAPQASRSDARKKRAPGSTRSRGKSFWQRRRKSDRTEG